MIRAPALAEHAAPAPGWLDAPIGPAGIALGMEQPGVPALVRLFRSSPTTVGVFGPAVLARLLALRALGAGAQVCVRTPHPAPWAALQPLPAGAAPWLTILPAGSPLPAGGTGWLPWLLIDEVDPAAPPARHQPAAWQAAVTVQPPLTPAALGSVRSYDLLLLHGVASQAVEPLRAATGIAEHSAKWLSQMPAEVVALVADGAVRYAVLALSPEERAALGLSSVTRR
jgi:hypothetical protein